MFSLIMYILVDLNLNKTIFPISVIWDDSPDYLFKSICIKGVEHTRSTIQAFENASDHLEKQPNGYKLEPSFYKPGRRMKRNEVDAGLRKSNEKLIGLGWVGKQCEYEWSQTIINAILKKNNIAQQYFKKNKNLSVLELIVQDKSPTRPYIHINDAYDVLTQNIKKYKLFYEKIHVIHSNCFMYDIQGASILLNISKPDIFNMYKL
ncbi:MAG: hypothetical protein ACTSXT_16225 [Candidatus Helarchaeota archaeon]